jgi:hypothetical protein
VVMDDLQQFKASYCSGLLLDIGNYESRIGIYNQNFNKIFIKSTTALLAQSVRA